MTGLDIVLTEAESRARARAADLAARGRLSPELYDLYRPPAAEEREARRLYAALVLADSADAFRALAAGRPVPASLLDRELIPGGQR